jgi:hypothetical protein
VPKVPLSTSLLTEPTRKAVEDYSSPRRSRAGNTLEFMLPRRKNSTISPSVELPPGLTRADHFDAVEALPVTQRERVGQFQFAEFVGYGSQRFPGAEQFSGGLNLVDLGRFTDDTQSVPIHIDERDTAITGPG